MRYFMPFCEYFGNLLSYPPINQKYFYYIYQYSRAAKSVVQIFLTVNRMTCVVIPTKHTKFWKCGARVAVVTTLILPLFVLYNPIFGRFYPGTVNGGIITKFTKPTLWANVAAIHLVLVVIALIFTTVCTCITLYGMWSLSNRLKSAEKSLCIASFIISAGFIVVGIVQLTLAMCDKCEAQVISDSLVTLTFCFDFLNVCSPLTVVIVSTHFRSQLLTTKGFLPARVDQAHKSPTVEPSDFYSCNFSKP